MLRAQPKPRHLAIHALHTTTGGGLVYLNNMLPHLAEAAAVNGDKITLFIRPEIQTKITVPANVTLQLYPMPLGFVRAHLKAQLWLPWVLRRHGVTHTLCNANFVPLLAPKPAPIIHTTPTVAVTAKSLFWRLYWKILWLYTFISIVRAPVAFSVANHVVPHYTPWPFAFLRKKIHRASPALNSATIPQPLPPKTKGKIIAIGDFYIQKDYPTLIAAFAQVKAALPHATLTIIGRPIMPDIARNTRAAIKAHGLEGAVTLAGGLPHHALMAELATAEVLLNTSTAECFNMPLLEAMAVNTAVVAPDTDFQREVVNNAKNATLVISPSAENYATATVNLLQNNHMRGTQVAAAKAHANTFSWADSAQVIAHHLLAPRP